MLEQVTANQTRFIAPGLRADARGVALGRYCVILLPSIDRVVGLFRGLSERGSLDDLLSSLKILQVTTPLKSREFIIQVPITSSHIADGIASVATLMGGLVFTGSSKHFVKFRDSQAPLGYDVANLHAGQGDFILYASEFVQVYNKDRELSFKRLVFSLSLELDPNDELVPGERSLLRVVPGLWRVVTAYLHRNNIPCSVAACEAPPSQATRLPEKFYLIRCQIEPRMERLFRKTPGIEVHRFHTDHVAVQIGYNHPIELGSISSIFEEESFYLFSGERDSLDTIHNNIEFISARSLVRLGGSNPPQVQQLIQTDTSGFSVPLRLVTSSGSRPPVRASRIPMYQAPWLKKLVYLLPPQVLESYSICCTIEYIYLLSEEQVEFIPLGTMFYQAAMGILLPIGFELLPKVHAEVLVQHLGTEQDILIFFSPDSPAPQQLSRSDFAILTRQALSQVHVEQAETTPLPEEQTIAPVQLVNKPIGSFPLWGFSTDSQNKPTTEEG